jgi:hypothetical protein
MRWFIIAMAVLLLPFLWNITIFVGCVIAVVMVISTILGVIAYAWEYVLVPKIIESRSKKRKKGYADRCTE